MLQPYISSKEGSLFIVSCDLDSIPSSSSNPPVDTVWSNEIHQKIVGSDSAGLVSDVTRRDVKSHSPYPFERTNDRNGTSASGQIWDLKTAARINCILRGSICFSCLYLYVREHLFFIHLPLRYI